MKRAFKTLIYCFLRIRRFNPYMAEHFAGLIAEDLKSSEGSIRQKIWAYRRGFLSHRVYDYHLTDENYKDYLSDYDYYKLFPLNGREQIWINDKMTMKYVLHPFDAYLPAYYYLLNNGEITKLMNADPNGGSDISDLLLKIKEDGALALKKMAASGGDGFYKAEYQNGRLLLNGTEYTDEEAVVFLKGLQNYLVMEYIVPHKEIRKYYANSPGVLRVMVISSGGKPFVANAYLRVGTTDAGYLDAHTGSISAVIDIKTGAYSEAFYHDGISFRQVQIHPDSNLKFEGVIPNWNMVKQKVLEIASYLPQLNYFGFDVCVTEDGMKIFEINSHQGIELFQISGPLLKDNPASEFFKQRLRR